MSAYRRIFRLIGREPSPSEDVAAEFESHLGHKTEALIREGMMPLAARQEAERRFGPLERFARECRTIDRVERRSRRRREWWAGILSDLRFALRGLRREKLFTAFVVVTLALGIGANAAMYGVIDRLLLRGPEHVVDPGRVVRAYWTSNIPPRGDVTTNYFGWVSYDIFRGLPVFDGAAAYTVNPRSGLLGEGAEATQVTRAEATWDLFPMLGVHPALGRFFNAAEDNTDAPQQVVVLGYALWQRGFGGDSAVIGKTLTLNSERFTVIGVAPHGFTGPQLAPADLWVPLSLRSRTVTNDWTRSFNAQWLRIVARLKPGVSEAQAGAAATAAYRAGYTGNDDSDRRASISFHPLSANNKGQENSEATISRWLFGVTLIVLLIACANVANLLLARAVRRRREVAVRIALGVGRGRLVRLMLTESGLLALAGAVAGLTVAWATASLMRNVLLPDIDWPSAPVNSTVLVVSLLLASVVGVVTGLVPALRASQPDIGAALKAGAREGGGRSSRLRAGLTVAQAALSILLLTGAGLFVRSLSRVRSLDMGIEPERVLVTRLRYATDASIADSKAAAEVARRTRVFHDAMLQARELPSVENSSLTIGLPFQSAFGLELRVAGWDSIPRLAGGSPNIAAVADGYFATVGTRLLEGREFGPADRDGSEPVAIVSRTMATTLWPGRSPIGECLYWAEDPQHLDTCSRIVGVVANANSFALREEPHMNYYIPFGQERGMGGTVLLVRPRPGQDVAATAAIKGLMTGLDPSITFVQTRSLQDDVDPQIRPWKLGAAMFTLLGVLALVVAAVGLYSVMSYLVAQRTREIGVRIALGAQASSIVSLIIRNGVTLAAIGVAIGTAIALGAGRFIAPLLFDTSPHDPLVLGGIAAVLLAVATLACVVPALRARRVDPREALQAE